MLKDRRFKREGKEDPKAVAEAVPKKVEKKETKGEKKGKGKGEKEKTPTPIVEEREVLDTEPEKVPTPEMTDDEEDSVIDDLEEPDYTHTEAHYRREND